MAGVTPADMLYRAAAAAQTAALAAHAAAGAPLCRWRVVAARRLARDPLGGRARKACEQQSAMRNDITPNMFHRPGLRRASPPNPAAARNSEACSSTVVRAAAFHHTLAHVVASAVAPWLGTASVGARGTRSASFTAAVPQTCESRRTTRARGTALLAVAPPNLRLHLTRGRTLARG